MCECRKCLADDMDLLGRADLKAQCFPCRVNALALHSSVAPVNFPSVVRALWRTCRCWLWVMCASTSTHVSAQSDPQPRNELGVFPLVGGDTDLGIGAGAFASFARFEPGYERYYGKHKLFGNLEARAQLSAFRLFGLAVQAAGRAVRRRGPLVVQWLWNTRAGWTRSRSQMGNRCGLALATGEAFVIRGDLAWSPDARPIGVYVTAGQVF
jgi:hypothetical protein